MNAEVGILGPVLNSIYDDLAASVGYTATVKLRTWFGGKRLYVPQRAVEGHLLEGLIGRPAFRALVRDFGADQPLELPLGEEERYVRDCAVARRFAAGDTVAQIAEQFDLSGRRVEQLREELVGDGILTLATGLARRQARGRPRAGHSAYAGIGLAENLGTGEVFADPPPPG